MNSSVRVLLRRGVEAYLGGRTEEARTAFAEALRLDPRNGKARWYLERIAAPTREPEGPGPASGDPVSAGRAPGAARLERLAAAPAREREGPGPASGDPASPGATPRDPGPKAPAREEPGGPYAPSPWDEGPAAAAPIELEAQGGLDLAAVAEAPRLRPLVPEGGTAAPAEAGHDVEVWLSAAKELFALGDFSGSLELIEKILKVDPDHTEARAYLAQNEATLTSMYESKLGPPSAVPRLAIKPEDIPWLNLDHRAGFLLAQIDGTVDYDSLFAISGLPRLDTARILADLIADGVITS